MLYILAGVVILWLMSGIYEIKEGQEGAVIRFGKFVKIAHPGLNYHLPSPIETVIIEEVNRSRRIEIGYRSGGFSNEYSKAFESESIMLTGDENIINLTVDVMYHIKDLPNFLFKVSDPRDTIKAVAQSVIREVIGGTSISYILSSQKQEIADKIHNLIQGILNNYDIGIDIEQVQLLKAEPPAEVIDAYRDVQTSKADKERSINQAQAYRNDVLPNARGQAAKLLQEAEGYKQEVIARAQGDVKRFDAILSEYSNNRKITKDRLMLDMVRDVLKGANKIIVSPNTMLPHMSLQQN